MREAWYSVRQLVLGSAGDILASLWGIWDAQAQSAASHWVCLSQPVGKRCNFRVYARVLAGLGNCAARRRCATSRAARWSTARTRPATCTSAWARPASRRRTCWRTSRPCRRALDCVCGQRTSRLSRTRCGPPDHHLLLSTLNSGHTSAAYLTLFCRIGHWQAQQTTKCLLGL